MLMALKFNAVSSVSTQRVVESKHSPMAQSTKAASDKVSSTDKDAIANLWMAQSTMETGFAMKCEDRA